MSGPGPHKWQVTKLGWRPEPVPITRGSSSSWVQCSQIYSSVLILLSLEINELMDSTENMRRQKPGLLKM